ncbi:MAG: hypothetical protein IJB59_12645 [Oscillospiraceae bacterium]|nr:hypothetical protein [Oscillospiraceae bacterium]
MSYMCPPSMSDTPVVPESTGPSYTKKENVQEYGIEIGGNDDGKEYTPIETTEVVVQPTQPAPVKPGSDSLSGAFFLAIALIVGMLFLFAKPKRDDDED